MARSPFPQDNDPAQALRTLIGRAGLDSLMQDPRYWDANHPDHGKLVDMMHAGFGLVFGKPGEDSKAQALAPVSRPGVRTLPYDLRSAPTRAPVTTLPYVPAEDTSRPMLYAAGTTARDPFAESFARRVPDTRGLEDLPPHEQRALGRGVVLDALRASGHPLPDGFDAEAGPGRANARLLRERADAASTQAQPDAARRDQAPPRDAAGNDAPPAATPDSQTAQADGETGKMAPDPSLNHGKPMALEPIGKWADPLPDSPISRKFRYEIHKRESRNGNYQTVNGTALGRYQLTKGEREQLHMVDENGNFTGKYGVHSKEEFLNDPLAQERAFADATLDNVRQLRKKGAMNHIGQKIDGIKAEFTVTESGPVAAAHRWGAGGTNQYLRHQQAHGWKSDSSNFPKDKRDMFMAIETRLREFQDIDYRAKR